MWLEVFSSMMFTDTLALITHTNEQTLQCTFFSKGHHDRSEVSPLLIVLLGTIHYTLCLLPSSGAPQSHTGMNHNFVSVA